MVVQNVSPPTRPDLSDVDVGSVAAPGGLAYDGNTYTVRGSGSDIWGRADGFRFAHTLARGNFSVDFEPRSSGISSRAEKAVRIVDMTIRTAGTI